MRLTLSHRNEAKHVANQSGGLVEGWWRVGIDGELGMPVLEQTLNRLHLQVTGILDCMFARWFESRQTVFK